ncbi:MAG: hypothetical protein ACR2N3_05640 [Pyrinomonadaceae bacterium]
MKIQIKQKMFALFLILGAVCFAYFPTAAKTSVKTDKADLVKTISFNANLQTRYVRYRGRIYRIRYQRRYYRYYRPRRRYRHYRRYYR